MKRATAERRHVPRPLRDAFAAARQAGWCVELSRGGHLRWVPRHRGARIVITPSTHSEYRGVRNDLAQLRRSGLDI